MMSHSAEAEVHHRDRLVPSWRAALLEEFGGAAMNLGFEFGDPSTRGDQFGVVGGGRAG
jgi:hypothetical protein